MAATEAMSGYALPPFKTSGTEGFIAAVDIIVEEAAVIVLVEHVLLLLELIEHVLLLLGLLEHVLLLLELLGDRVRVPEVGYPGCLVPVSGQGLDIGCVRGPDLMSVGVGFLQLVQFGPIACIGPWHEVDVLHKVIVPACLALVGPGGDPGDHRDLHGSRRRAGQHRHLHRLAETLLGLSVDLGCGREHGGLVLWSAVLSERSAAGCSLPDVLALGQEAGCTVAWGSQWLVYRPGNSAKCFW